jgi:ABC-type antimicrobial peptide transport system permease subunit
VLDYAAYANYYANVITSNLFGSPGSAPLPINTIWLRTQDSPTLLVQLRATLQHSASLRVSNLFDRRAISQGMGADALQTGLLVFLTLGACVALLLALIGNLLISWLSVSARLINFSILRALGTTGFQITRILLWEQLITYGSALVLGVGLGTLLARTVVPTLTFVDLPASGALGQLSSTSFYLLQKTTPIQIVVPQMLNLIFIALVLICSLALFVMSRAVHRVAISQMLRLSED